MAIDKMGKNADKSNMATKTGKQKVVDKGLGYKERRKRLLLLLPKHGFKIAPAAMEAGWSESYSRRDLPGRLRRDPDFQEQLDRLREQDCAIQQDKVAAVDSKLRNILDDNEIPVNTKLKAIELFYRRHGLLSQQGLGEGKDRERELSATARRAAIKLSKHMMNTRQAGDKSIPKVGQTPSKPPAKAG